MPLEKLADNSTLSQPEKLAEVSRQFEAVLLRQILSEAQKPVFKSTVNSSPLGGDVYRDIVTNELADQISRSGIGLAEGLERQMQRQLRPPGADKPVSGLTVPKEF